MGISDEEALHLFVGNFPIGIHSLLAILNVFEQATLIVEYLRRFHLVVLNVLLDQVPLKSNPIFIILAGILLIDSHTDVHLVINCYLYVNLVHAVLLEMVNPTKLLERFLVVSLQERLFYVFVEIYFLAVVEAEYA